MFGHSESAVILQYCSKSQPYHILLSRYVPGSVLVLEPLFTVAAMLFSLAIATILLYYRRIRQASKAYEEAKTAVGDIVVSFDRQLSRQDDKLGAVIQRIETQASRNDKLSSRLDEQENRVVSGLADLRSRVAELPDVKSVETTLKDLENKVEGLVKAQEEWKRRAMAVADSPIEAVIPLKREQALAPLTETELRVLEFIAASPSGRRTAPEVKEMIRLTREHTARLLKKLYEGGYVERRAEKTPYAYSVKEEMLKLLKKSEAKA